MHFSLSLFFPVPPSKPLIRIYETGEIVQGYLGPYQIGTKLTLLCQVIGGKTHKLGQHSSWLSFCHPCHVFFIGGHFLNKHNVWGFETLITPSNFILLIKIYRPSILRPSRPWGFHTSFIFGRQKNRSKIMTVSYLVHCNDSAFGCSKISLRTDEDQCRT